MNSQSYLEAFAEQPKPGQFRCTMCHGIFDKGLSEEEALAELRQYFGDTPPEQCELVCDDCWMKIHPQRN